MGYEGIVNSYENLIPNSYYITQIILIFIISIIGCTCAIIYVKVYSGNSHLKFFGILIATFFLCITSYSLTAEKYSVDEKRENWKQKELKDYISGIKKEEKEVFSLSINTGYGYNKTKNVELYRKGVYEIGLLGKDNKLNIKVIPVDDVKVYRGDYKKIYLRYKIIPGDIPRNTSKPIYLKGNYGYELHIPKGYKITQ